MVPSTMSFDLMTLLSAD
uniref:Uncharacterized protein n=1 Tax=Arundo donax TaxID=35708 RepID=A0A0A9EIF5_ARUDO